MISSHRFSQALILWFLTIKLFWFLLPKPGVSQTTQADPLSLIHLANSSINQGNVERGITLLQEAITIGFSDANALAVAYGLLGKAHLSLGLFDESIEFYQKALTISANQATQTLALLHLSQAYAHKAHEQQLSHSRQSFQTIALSFAQHAYDLAPTPNLKLSAIIDLLALTQPTEASQPTQTWLTLRNEGLAILASLPTEASLIPLILRLHPFLPPDTALSWLTFAFELSSEQPSLFSLVAEQLAQHHAQQLNWEQAVQFNQLALLHTPPQSRFRYRLLWQAAHLARSTGKPEQALIFSDLTLAELQQFSPVKSVPQSGSQRERILVRKQPDLISQISREYLALLLETGTPPQLRKALLVKRNLQRQQLENQFPSLCFEFLHQLTQESEPLKPLESGQALIDTLSLPEATYLILRIGSLQPQLIQINLTQPELEAKLRKWRKSLENISSNQYLDLSLELYQLLIEPLIPSLQQAHIRHLIFINDGLFHNLPLAALHDGQQFLGENYVISYRFGLGSPPTQTPINTGNQSVNLLWGLSEAIPPFSSLPFVPKELEGIRENWPSQIFLEQDFTYHNLEKALKNAQINILHLATHSSFQDDLDQSFLLAYDQKITLAQLEQLLRRSQTQIALLVLSACETASGNEHALLGLLGIALNSGIENVIGSLWHINDYASSQLMISFYQHLKQGEPPAFALHKAQLSFLSNYPDSHPALWSAFVFYQP